MPSNPQRKLPLQAARPAYRTLQGWALGTLIEQAQSWNASTTAIWRNPFPGVTAHTGLRR